MGDQPRVSTARTRRRNPAAPTEPAVTAQGHYVVVADVSNPMPHRGRHGMENAVVWPAGTVVEVVPIDALRGKVWFTSGAVDYSFHPDDAGDRATTQGNALVGVAGALAPNPRTLGLLLRLSVVSAAEILAVLVDTGVVTLDDVAGIAETSDDRDWTVVRDKHQLRLP